MSNFLINLSDVRVLNKNYLINGALDFWQRGTSFVTSTSNTLYASDRWRIENGGGGGVSTTTTRQTSVPTGTYFPFSMRSIRTVGTGDHVVHHVQRIEAINVKHLVGKTLTFSFWVKAEGTSTDLFARIFTPVSGSNDTWGERTFIDDTLVVIYSGVIDSTWKKFSYSFLVPESATNGLAVDVSVQMNNTNDGFSSTGFQLEEGRIATDFVRAGGNVAGELQLCQRYYEKSYPVNIAPGTSSATGAASGQAYGVGIVEFYTKIVEKRAIPQATIYSITGTQGSITNLVNATQFGPGFTSLQDTSGFSVVTSGSGLTIGNIYRWNWTADAEL